ncbi:ABC transporter permease [Sinomicrobium weinanense]|uniref:ABC transporter permease n=1 Tax=Sinomicrobium weinanense TaxID=2842200 RepID=A0A926JNW5_9FLAO|nr:FtsX-like permease family protein [Sinomicrobium weinanense]MBC9794758.1 ABC transporter permease [Sinomicrobium weinanense]MBU3125017.1 ABC transporter permease [Sinomicrobium weinanense]
MIRNYFKIAWRNLRKDKSFTLINLIGLSTGFAITLLIVQYARFELSYENTHENADDIVRLTMDYFDGESVTTQDSETYSPLGPLMTNELTEVTNFTRAYQIGEPKVGVSIGDKLYTVDRTYAVDSSFFKLFTYPLIHGSEKGLFRQPNEVVLTKSTALKLFGREQVVGKTLNIYRDNWDIPFKVVGVVADSPANTHLKFDILLSYPTMLSGPMQKWFGEKEDNWNGNNTFTYVQLAPHTDYEKFTRSLASFSKKLEEEKKITNEAVIGQKIKDIHLYSKKTFEPEINGDARSVFFLLGVALLIIVSAFVNYINLATSKALDRAKEVGIRKVAGSSKTQLKIQFLTESLMVNFIAVLLAFVFILGGKHLFISISGLPETFALFGDPYFWILFIALFVTGVFVSGIYPALVLSSFKPVTVLKGSFSHSGKGVLLRKGLVVFQFTVTLILLIQTFTVKQQLDYLQTLDKGINPDQIIVTETPLNRNDETGNIFKQELLAQSYIDHVSVSETVPGQMGSEMATTPGISLAGTTERHYYNFYITQIDDGFIPLMGMQLLAGRNFDKNSTPEKNEIIVNEEAIRLWGLSDPQSAIDKQIEMWKQKWTIRGVLKNYNQESPKAPFIPIIHRFKNTSSEFTSIRFSGGRPEDHIKNVKNIYERVFPGTVFSYFFLDSNYEMQLKADKRFRNVFTVLAVLAIIIACLGLYGLASFTVLKRQKEIGIRKVIGASTSNVLLLLSKDFFRTVLVAVFLGVPVTYLFTRNWLSNFAMRIDMSWWLFALPVLLVFVLVVVAVGIKTLKIAITNPVKSLRTE